MTRVELARHMTPDPKSGASSFPPHLLNWGDVIRTHEYRSQSPGPYRLATPHYYFSDPSDNTTRTVMLPLGISKEKKKI